VLRIFSIPDPGSKRFPDPVSGSTSASKNLSTFIKKLQCCGSGMFIPDPDFYPSRISDPGSRIQKQQQKRGVNKNLCHTFFCSHKFLIERFTQKLVTKLTKIWVWDPRSGIRKKPIPDPGSKGSKKHRIPDPDPQH
jgi:hypothetical protein